MAEVATATATATATAAMAAAAAPPPPPRRALPSLLRCQRRPLQTAIRPPPAQGVQGRWCRWGKEAEAASQETRSAHRPAAQAVEQEYLNEIHLLGADFVIPADTPAHATHDDPKIWQNEITYRKKKLERIEAHGNFFVAGLGKQNVRIRVSFVMCVHHRSVGPYHGRVVLARSAGGGQAGRKTGTTDTNVAIVEVDTRHWHSGDEKCPHLPNQKEPPCSRCRVPVKFVVQISGEPKFVNGDQFLMGYRAFGGDEVAKTALASDKFRKFKLGKSSTYSCASLYNPAQSGASAKSASPKRRKRPLVDGASSTPRDLQDDDDDHDDDGDFARRRRWWRRRPVWCR